MRSLTEDVEGAQSSVVAEANAAIANLLDIVVAKKRNEARRRECYFKTQVEGVCWGGERRMG